MNIDDELETMEQTGETEAEEIDERSEMHDVEDDMGEYPDEDAHDLEEEIIEMEIEDGDIYAYLVDEDDNEIGFVLLDENGEEQEYYYVDEDEYEIVEETTKVVRAEDGEEFDLGITREGVAEATSDMNAVYREGAAVVAELKETFDDINESMSFLKKR